MELKNFFAQDLQGNVIPSPTVHLYQPGTTTLATGLKDAAGADLANPFTGTANGQVTVAAPDGDYDMRVTGAGRDTTMRVRFLDASEGGVLAFREDMASTADGKGAALVGFKQSGTGAVSRTVRDKLRDTISVFDFMTAAQIASVQAANLVEDVTAPIHAAITHAAATNRAVYFPAGNYRVTSGFTQSTNYRDVRLIGEGRGNQNVIAPYAGSYIVLDSTDAASFFYNQVGYGSIMAEDLNFRCKQTVKDRKFFKISSSSCNFHFQNCNFSSVEKPINFEVGCYFQMGLIDNVQFHNSGTIHSYVGGVGETNSLRGTLLTINNVNHEGGVPDNSEKVVCNLQAVREIQITNLLLEGALPYTGWTCLKFSNPFDANWGRSNIAQINGLHIEFVATTGPNTTIDVNGGVVQCYAYGSSPEKVKVSNKGVFILHGFGFSGSGSASVASYFDIADIDSLVILNECSGIVPTFDNPNIICNNFLQIAQTTSVGTNLFDAGVSGNNGSSELFRYEGGFNLPGGQVGLNGATTYYASTDATYGRKLVFVPSAGNVSFKFTTTSYAGIRRGDPLWVSAYLRLPTFGASGGKIGVTLEGAGGNGSQYFAIFDSSQSGQVVKVCGRVMRPTADPTGQVGITIAMIVATDITAGNLEVLSLVMGTGNTFPRTLLPRYPAKIQTFATAAPTAGTWVAGDRVLNSAPATGQPKGWVCTVGGTPGTWVSEGNL